MPVLPKKLKRYLSIAFFAAIVFFGVRIFSVEHTACEILLRWDGEELQNLQAVEARLFTAQDDEVLGSFTAYFDMPTHSDLGRWPLIVAPGGYLLEIDLRTTTRSVTIKRKVVLVDGETSSVYVGLPTLVRGSF